MDYKILHENFYNTCLTRIMGLISVKPDLDKKTVAKGILDKYLQRTILHINLVLESSKILADTYCAEMNCDKETFFTKIEAHDADKLNNEDTIVYYAVACEKVYGTPTEEWDCSQNVIDRWNDVEWPKHWERNQHHVPEHLGKKVNGCWILPEGEYRYAITEMVADWTAMWIELNHNTPTAWLNRNNNKEFELTGKNLEWCQKLCSVIDDNYIRVQSIAARYELPTPKQESQYASEAIEPTQMQMVGWDGSDEQLKYFAEADRLAGQASHDNDKYTLQDIKDYIKRTHSTIQFFIVDKEVVGAVAHSTLTSDDRDKGWFSDEVIGKKYSSIHDFAILEKYQGKGYGRQALKLTIDHLFGLKNMNYILLGVAHDNTKAVSLYTSFGFNKVNSGKYGKHVRDLMMLKKSSSIESVEAGREWKEENITNITTLRQFLMSVKYGYGTDPKASWKAWKLTTVADLLKNKIGCCADTSFVADYFLKKIKNSHKCYFICQKGRTSVENNRSHTFNLYLSDDGEWRWLEPSWGKFRQNNFHSKNESELVTLIAKLHANMCKTSVDVRSVTSWPATGCDMETFVKHMVESSVISTVEPGEVKVGEQEEQKEQTQQSAPSQKLERAQILKKEETNWDNKPTSNESFSFLSNMVSTESLDPEWATKASIEKHATPEVRAKLDSYVKDYYYHGSPVKYSQLVPQVRNDTPDASLFFSPFAYIASLFCNENHHVRKGLYDNKEAHLISWKEVEEKGIYDGLDKPAVVVEVGHNIKDLAPYTVEDTGYLYLVKKDRIHDKVLPYNRWSQYYECIYFGPSITPDKVIPVKQITKVHYDKRFATNGDAVPTNKHFTRVTYDGIGVYEALKQNMTESEWRQFKRSDAATWLPLPTCPYKQGYLSYFTERGFATFMEKTKPYIVKHLDESRLDIRNYNISSASPNIVYSDKYQIVTDGKESISSESLSYFDIAVENLPDKDTAKLITQSGKELWIAAHSLNIDKTVHVDSENTDLTVHYVYTPSFEAVLPFPTTGIYKEIEKRARPHYNATGKNSWVHIQRVFSQATRICRFTEKRDLNPNEYAAVLFHDSSVKTDVDKKGHAGRGAKIAETDLVDIFTKEDLDDIVNAIAEHDDKIDHKSTTADMLASGDFNPPDPPWILNKAYEWCIKNRDKVEHDTHESRIDHIVNDPTSVKANYGSKSKMIYPRHYRKYFDKKIKEMNVFFDNLTYEQADKIITEYRKAHHLGPNQIGEPEPSVESFSFEDIHHNVGQHIKDNKVYHCSPEKYDKLEMKYMGKWYDDKKGIFVTPFVQIASCFIINKQEILDKIQNSGINTHDNPINFKYDVWDKPTKSLERQEPPEHIIVTIKGLTGFKEFSGKATGYLYTIDYSKYKDKTSMFKKSETSDVEFIINDDITPEKVAKISVDYTVRPGKAVSQEEFDASKFKPIHINKNPSPDRFANDTMKINKIDTSTLNMDIVNVLAKQDEYLEIVRRWLTVPDYSLTPKLIEFGKFVDKLYGFDKSFTVYRAMRIGRSTLPIQQSMGIVDNTEIIKKPKPFVVPGYKFTYMNTGPLSTTRAVWISKVYGDLIVKTQVRPETSKLMLTNELAYVLQALDEKYPYYRPLNLSSLTEVLLFPDQTLNYQVVTTNGDILSEMPEFKEMNFKDKKIELDPSMSIGEESLAEMLVDSKTVKIGTESLLISNEKLEVTHDYILNKLREGQRCNKQQLMDLMQPGDILIPYPKDKNETDFMKIFHAIERTAYGMSFTSCKLVHEKGVIIGYGVKNKIERGKSAFDKTTFEEFLKHCGGIMVLRTKHPIPPTKLKKLHEFMERYYKDASNHDFSYWDATVGTIAYLTGLFQGEVDPKKMDPEDYNKLVCSSVVAGAFRWADIDLGLPPIKIARIMPIHMAMSEKLKCVGYWFAPGEWNPKIEKQIASLTSNESFSTEALSEAAITKKKKEIIDKICKICDIIDPSKLNSNRYHKILDHMSPKEFDKWMNYVKDGKWVLHIVAPNMVVNLKNENLLKAADAVGIKLFHRIWMTDNNTGRTFLTDNEYLVLPLPIRRQQQFLDEKMSVPEDDKHIDGMTGQVTGDSKATQITNPEINILAFRGLDTVLEEMVNVRGGNMVAYGEFRKQAEETGEIHMSELDPSTRSRTAVIAQVLLNAMHIENNIV